MSPLAFHTPPDSASEDETPNTPTMKFPRSTSPAHTLELRAHSDIVIDEWDILSKHVDQGQPVFIDTEPLSIASIVAVSR